MKVTFGELAARISARVEGDPNRAVSAVRPLAEAGPDDLSLYTAARYRDLAVTTRAGGVLVPPALEAHLIDRSDVVRIVVEDPAWALAEILALLYPEPRAEAGIHPTAIVDPTAEVDPSCSIGPYAVIGARSRLAARVEVGPFVAIGRDCVVGDGSLLYAHAVLYDRTEIGSGSILHAGAVIGSDGFGYATRSGVHHKVPQVGRVVLEGDVEVGANATIDRATLGETRVGQGAKIDNLVQVGHNVRVGAGSILCGQAGIAGSSELGRYVVLAGQTGVAGHLKLADGVQVGAKSAVFRDVETPGVKLAGIPAIELSRWRRQAARVGKIEELFQRLERLSRRLDRLERGQRADLAARRGEGGGEEES